jgi:alpha-1,2-mannosyltransferase
VDTFLKRKQFLNVPLIVSFAQFRPEKNHLQQIRVMKQLVKGLPEEISQQVKLLIIGSCRNDDDERLLASLQALVQREKLQGHVAFKKNPSYPELVTCLTNAMMGLHTMEYEHFGIALVEMMVHPVLH